MYLIELNLFELKKNNHHNVKYMGTECHHDLLPPVFQQMCIPRKANHFERGTINEEQISYSNNQMVCTKIAGLMKSSRVFYLIN